MSSLELIAVGCGLACVWLTIKERIACWPVGLIQVLLYVFVFYRVRLYADMALHVFYVFLQFYGWYQWKFGGPQRTELIIGRIATTEVIAWLGLATGLTFLVGALLAKYTDAALPYPDSAIMMLSLIAQVLMARKILESWLVWMVVDLIAIVVYWIKDLRLTCGLYTVFLLMAALGFIEWHRRFRHAQAA